MSMFGVLRSPLCLGERKGFLDVSNGALELVLERPKHSVIQRIEDLINSSSDKVVAELRTYSVIELGNVVTNLSYLTEKLNRDSRLQVNISEFFKCVLGGLGGITANFMGQNAVLGFSVGFCALPIIQRVYTYVANHNRQGVITEGDASRFREKISNLVLPIINAKQFIERGVQYAGIDRLFVGIDAVYSCFRKVRPIVLEDIHLYREVVSFVQRKQSEGYYTFLHGQSLKIAMISRFLTKLLQRLEPTRDFSDFHCVRLVTNKDCASYQRNARDFIRRHLYLVIDQLPYYGDKLLAVTVNPLDNTPVEMAFWYWIFNGSVSQDVPDVVIDDVQRAFNLEESTSSVFQETFRKVNEVLYATKPFRSGNLMAICVPKETIENPKTNMAYRSFPWGIPRNPFAPQEVAKYLSRDWISSDSCQARLLTNQLIPENGIKTYHFNTLTESETQACDALLATLTDFVTNSRG